MSSRPIIPGLIRELYFAGSRHTASTPDLIRSNVDGKAIDFEWKATGSDVYKVVANGLIDIIEWDREGMPRFDSDLFQVTCSCPDGARQRVTSNDSGKLYVCKHAKSALDSAIDASAAENVQSQKKARAAEASRKRADRTAYLENQREQQEKKLPGERDRIEHGLSKRSTDEIMNFLKESIATVDGLEALTKVFPVEKMPVKKTTKCGRCKKEYDPSISSDQVCRMEHPYEKVGTEWDGSKKSWDHCRQCNKTFNLNGFHSWGKRGRNDPYDEGEYCYVDTHVPEEGYVACNDQTIQMLNDESDY
mmetsp:Transcript_43105/g.84703  ORF Transcript_43105/g.84703 Transcript_43105/m.84703 type:complete len:305 (+) Transcript_43105:111-1025(+)|eukprot:CAMPEP_0194311810 /NCGR_PEP_ID=MMETSP0171-20130528/8736_1 /TAXON_ID=218684 /ORGANISM="Corethron pennatum, Strain L29A3" /LENGTH=304 /DNA_ID=CAMNT_0039066037 /DNA_START=58 /DNA_END=972 /DNA_ORIENTATION=+